MTIATGDAILYAVLLIGTFLIDTFVIYLINRLSLSNPSNERGEFIGVNLMKYVKIILVGIMWPLILITLNLMNAAATSLTDITQFSGIIGFLFEVLLRASWVWTIGIIVWIGYNAVKDSQISKQLKELQSYMD